MNALKTVRILVSEAGGFSDRAAALLRRAGCLQTADLDRPGLLSAVRDADVLWVRLRHHIDEDVLAAAPRLKFIATPTTGLNHMDLAAAERRGIRVLSLRGEAEFLKEVRATAEHAMGLMLALLRHTRSALTDVLDGAWNRDAFRGQELHGRTIGVIGYGRLGQIVARYLNAFDSRVLVTDPNISCGVLGTSLTSVPLPQLLREADLITLHVNLTESTRGFFGRAQFAAMRDGAWFVNTARGELVDEAALLDALRCGKLSGAALDVLRNERADGMAHHPLVAYARQHDNVIITPHLGGCTAESMEKTEIFLAEKLCAALSSL